MGLVRVTSHRFVSSHICSFVVLLPFEWRSTTKIVVKMKPKLLNQNLFYFFTLPMSTQLWFNWYAFQPPEFIFPGCWAQSLTSAWLPADRVLLHLSQRRQGRCQFLPSDDTFSAAETPLEKTKVVLRSHLNPPPLQYPPASWCKHLNAYQNTLSCCTVDRYWVLQRRRRNSQLKKKDKMNHFSRLQLFPWCPCLD